MDYQNEIERLHRIIESQQRTIENQSAELSRIDQLIADVYQTIEAFKQERLRTEERFRD